MSRISDLRLGCVIHFTRSCRGFRPFERVQLLLRLSPASANATGTDPAAGWVRAKSAALCWKGHKIGAERRLGECTDSICDIAIGRHREQVVTNRVQFGHEIGWSNAGLPTRAIADLQHELLDSPVLQQVPRPPDHPQFETFDVDLEEVDLIES